MQLKYSNYVAFSHFHGKAVNNSGLESVSFHFYLFLSSFCLSALYSNHVYYPSEKASFCTPFVSGGPFPEPPLTSDITVLSCYGKYFISVRINIH